MFQLPESGHLARASKEKGCELDVEVIITVEDVKKEFSQCVTAVKVTIMLSCMKHEVTKTENVLHRETVIQMRQEGKK